MTDTKPTVTEMIESLTGVEEDLIVAHFGAGVSSFDQLLAGNPIKAGRALLFTLRRRDGVSEAEAKKFARGVTRIELDSHFSDAPDDDDLPGAPLNEAGKDVEPSETQPENE